MEVRADNFEAALPVVLEAIRGAAVVAFDTEMTGLRVDPRLRDLGVDTLDARWAKTRNAANYMAVLQYGLCAFRYDADAGAYVAQPFSFFLTPRAPSEGARASLDPEATEAFVAQLSAVQFLARHGFDFNKMAAAGVPYLSRAEGNAVTATVFTGIERRFVRQREVHAGRGGFPPILWDAAVGDRHKTGAAAAVAVTATAGTSGLTIGAGDARWYAELADAIAAWLERVAAWSHADAADAAAVGTDDGGVVVDAAGHPVLTLPRANAFRRHVIRAHVSAVAHDRVVPILVDDESAPADSRNDRAMALVWVGPRSPGFTAWEAGQLASALAAADASLAAATGFRTVMDALSAARVPLVGHNCMLDVGHSAAKFLGRLPPGVTAAAAAWVGAFPYTFDTKHMITERHSDAVVAMVQRPFGSRNDLGSAFALLNADSLALQLPGADGGGDGAATTGGGGGGGGKKTPTLTLSPLQLCPVVLAPGFRVGSTGGAGATAEMPSPAPPATPAMAPTPPPGASGMLPAPGTTAIDADDAAHDAGADACMTGIVFLRVCALAYAASVHATTGTAPATSVAAVVTRALSAACPRPASAAAVPELAGSLGAYLSSSINCLHVRLAEPAHRVLNLSDAAAAATPASATDASRNSFLRARGAANRTNVAWLSGFGSLLADSSGAGEVVTLVARALEIRPALIDRRKHVHVLDAGSCFVTLPSAAHVRALADAATAAAAAAVDTGDADDSPAVVAAAFPPPPTGLVGLLGGGDNMLGIGYGAEHLAPPTRVERAAEAAAAAAAAAAEDAAVHGPAVHDLLSAWWARSRFAADGVTSLPPPAPPADVSLATLTVRTYADFLAEFRGVFGHGTLLMHYNYYYYTRAHTHNHRPPTACRMCT